MPRLALVAALFSASLLSACDLLGIEAPEKTAAAREADGRAIGGACRHAGRAIEDCYALNRKAERAAIFAGWRDMNDYMRENKIEPVAPQVQTQLAKAADKPAVEADAGPPADKRAGTAAEAAKGKTKEAKAHAS
jgi:hypothetical protein